MAYIEDSDCMCIVIDIDFFGIHQFSYDNVYQREGRVLQVGGVQRSAARL